MNVDVVMPDETGANGRSQRELADHQVLDMVLARGRVELAAALAWLRQTMPEVTSFEVAESVSRLHRRGLIRISEELIDLRGEKIRAAVLMRP